MNLPLWYPFKTVQETVIKREESQEIVKERILLLINRSPSRSFKKLGGESLEEFARRAKRELFAHGLLRLASTIDIRLASWLVETEGDLFYYRYKNSKLEEKQDILTHLYSKEGYASLNILESKLKVNLEEKFGFNSRNKVTKTTRSGHPYLVPDKTGANMVIGIHFRQIPTSLKQRRYILYKGWVIAQINQLLPVIKKSFEHKLFDRIQKLGERIKNNKQVLENASKLNEVIYNSFPPDTIIPQHNSFNPISLKLGSNLESNQFSLPPCIQDLITKISKTGYLPHWERFQLGIFLKVTGMDVTEQLQYWYNKAVDNISLSFEEFNKKAGYIIRHIYGLEGGKIDYEMPSCKTVIDKMHCTFSHSGVETVGKILDNSQEKMNLAPFPKQKKLIKREIIDLTQKFEARKACRKFLNFITEDFDEEPPIISHPLQYLQLATTQTLSFAEKKNVSSQNTNTNPEVSK